MECQKKKKKKKNWGSILPKGSGLVPLISHPKYDRLVQVIAFCMGHGSWEHLRLQTNFNNLRPIAITYEVVGGGCMMKSMTTTTSAAACSSSPISRRRQFEGHVYSRWDYSTKVVVHTSHKVHCIRHIINLHSLAVPVRECDH